MRTLWIVLLGVITLLLATASAVAAAVLTAARFSRPQPALLPVRVPRGRVSRRD